MVERLSQGVVMMRLVLGLAGERDSERDATGVERAIAEFRSARPVVVEGPTGKALVVGVEDLDADKAARLGAVAAGQAHLVLSAGAPASARPRPAADRDRRAAVIDHHRIETLALKVDGAHRRAGRSGQRARRGRRSNSPASRSSCRPWSSSRSPRASRSSPRSCACPVRRSGVTARREVQQLKNRQPGARAARGRAGERIRGLSRRRGPARPGRDHRRQAGSRRSPSPCACTRPA